MKVFLNKKKKKSNNMGDNYLYEKTLPENEKQTLVEYRKNCNTRKDASL